MNQEDKCRCVTIMGDVSSVVCPIHGNGAPARPARPYNNQRFFDTNERAYFVWSGTEWVREPPAVNAPEGTMTREDMIRDLAAGLRDVIRGASDEYVKEDPENAFIDLACTLMLRLRGKLTVVPTSHVHLEHAEAAMRILDILTRWMKANPGCSYTTKISETGTFQIVVNTSNGPKLFFGENLQDAYAQAAQTINFSRGKL